MSTTCKRPSPLPADHALRRGPSALLGLGVIGLAVLGAGALIDREQFFRSYLVAFMFWGGIAFGCFGLVALNHITGGRWGIVIRRICEAGIAHPAADGGALPADRCSACTTSTSGRDPSVVAHDKVLQYKAACTSTSRFFLVRAVFYFASGSSLGACSAALVAASRTRTGDPKTVALAADARPRRPRAVRADHDLRRRSTG